MFGFDPNPLQRAVVARSESIGGPFLAIVEAAMGGGKTEAALWATDVALCQGVASGFYLALPTQATSNAMHTRLLGGYFGKRGHEMFKLDLQLAHGNALLHEQRTAPIYDEHEGDRPSRDNKAAAQSWFSGRKRPLLATFGVGTIDQSLLGALQTPHWFVRLFGMAGKVVIFDEIHSYDVYMSALLERLLQWLRALGCSVILLSATLPRAKRHALLQAWGTEPPHQEASYPRLTWASGEGDTGHKTPATSHAVNDFEKPEERAAPKTIALEVVAPDAQVLADKLKRALIGGGCAAIICNTVRAAQEMFAALRHELKGFIKDEDFHLLHARMPLAWRQKREDEIVAKFGKKKANRPKHGERALVVSTQILEQSLDIDFDWMASEMAPLDLLLQRMGRLHRHDKDEHGRTFKRPQVLEEARLLILCAHADREVPPKYFGPYENTVYERYVLLRSWLALRGKEKILLPCQIEKLVEQVYGEEPSEMQDPNGEWRQSLDKTWASFEQGRAAAQSKAAGVVVCEPGRPKYLVEKFSLQLEEDDDPRVHQTLRAATRDGQPSVSVACLLRTSRGVFLPDQNGDPDHAHPVDLSAKPSLDQARALLHASLPVSQPALFKELSQNAAPPGWRDSPHLRFHRAVEFPESDGGRALVAGHTLRLDGELGLVIEKEEEGD